MKPLSALHSRECNKRTLPFDIREAIADVFVDKQLIVDKLLHLLSSKHYRYRPLNLNAFQDSNSGILACANHADSVAVHEEVWSSKYEAFVYHLPSVSDDSDGRVSFVRALLVGFIDSDPRGSIYISGDCWDGRVRLVIAPPPHVRLRHSAVWIRDWRFVPSTSGSGVFEVLLKDIVCLSSETQNDCRFHSIDPDLISDKSVKNLCGVVRAKSCIVASKTPKPCFLIEMSSFSNRGQGCHSVVIVFPGTDAVKWWPFLWVGQEIGVTGLRVSQLPRYENRVVLKAQSPASSCYFLSRAPCSDMLSEERNGRLQLEHIEKKRRLDANDDIVGAIQFHSPRNFLTYEGEITTVLTESKFELDCKVLLHLAEFKDLCAGPRVAEVSLRRGTRIVASWVSFTACNGRLNLFPTGRSSIAVQYFGELDFSANPIKSDASDAWRWIWKRWNFHDIVWADDLYCSFDMKFGPWFKDVHADLQGKPEAKMSQYLLGTRCSPGLIQFIMFLLSGRKDLLDTNVAASRDIYAEFLFPSPALENHDRRPCTPSLLAVSEITQHLWKKTTRGYLERDKPQVAPKGPQTQVIFQSSEIFAGLLNKSFRTRAGGAQGSLALIGLLQGSSSGDRRVTLSDCSASIFMQAIGRVPLSAYGSIVAIGGFQIVADALPVGNCCEITLLCDASAIQEVVTCSSNSSSSGLGLRGSQVSASRHVLESDVIHSIQMHHVSPTKALTAPSSPLRTPMSSAANCPMVCIFADRITPGTETFTISGHLVAMCDDPLLEEWTPLIRIDQHFYRCCLVLSGESALRLSSGLHTNSLFAISCSELLTAGNTARYVKDKIAGSLHNNNTLQLETCFEHEIPRIVDLFQGLGMRFHALEAFPDSLGNNAHGFVSTFGEKLLGSSGGIEHSCIIRSIERVSEACMDAVVTLLWRASAFKEPVRDDEILTLRGTVQKSIDLRGRSASNDSSRFWELCIQDEKFAVFRITVSFYERRYTPRGLGPGMVVMLHNVARVPNRSGPRFRFVGNKATFVELISAPMPDEIRKCSMCQDCKDPPPLAELLKFLHYAALLDFSEWKECQKKHSCETGVVRFLIVRIDYLKVGCVRGPRCSNCQVEEHQDGEVWNVAASVVATIEDGSAGGKLRCDGFRNVMKLLGANREECVALKSLALVKGGFEMCRELAEAKLNGPTETGPVDKCLSVLCKLMCRKRDDRVVALALNQTRLRLPGVSSLVSESEIVMQSFRLGFGRRLWTSCSDRTSVTIECLAVYDNYGQNLTHSGVNLATTATLRHLLSEQQQVI